MIMTDLTDADKTALSIQKVGGYTHRHGHRLTHTRTHTPANRRRKRQWSYYEAGNDD